MFFNSKSYGVISPNVPIGPKSKVREVKTNKA